MFRRRREDRKDDRGEGTPRVWHPSLRPFDPYAEYDELVELPRYAREGAFGPSLYGFRIPWT
jgi:hypothetical protein